LVVKYLFIFVRMECPIPLSPEDDRGIGPFLWKMLIFLREDVGPDP
jgi:hypothetical protein